MFLFLFISAVFSFHHYIYISNDGRNDNNGSYAFPLNASNFLNVRQSMNKLSPKGTDNLHLVFKEGTYFSDGWSLLFWEFDHAKIKNVIFEGEPGKNVVLHGSNIITNWTKSDTYENIWTTYYSEKIDQLFIGDRRAILCRMPKRWKRARFYGYETREDPTNSSYLFRYLYVQKDCIEMLKKMTREELSESEVVVTYWYFIDIMKIVDFDEDKRCIITRILKKKENSMTISETSYFFIQGAFPSLTEPGEYYHHPNGTLYYYPHHDEDMNTIDAYVPKTNFVIQFNGIKNLVVQNLHFKYIKEGIKGVDFNNFSLYKCEFKHIKSALTIYSAHNSKIDHCLIEDVANTGLTFAGNNFTVHNCIIRHVGVVPPYGYAIDFWNNLNDTYILNNDISDNKGALIHFGYGAQYEVNILKKVLIENNHMHHCGYGMFDDLAALFFGMHPRGTIVNHNKIHDFFAHNYCGNGIYPDTGSSGSLITNNLVYNLSDYAFNMHSGKENEVSNNIMAFAKAGFNFGYYHNDSYTLNIHHNIVYLDKDDATFAHGPLLDKDVTNYFNNNIYYKTNNRTITIKGLSFEEWQRKGFDKNSLIIDPLFKAPERGDFSFRSKENADKIGFKEFNMTFGVIGDEWRRVAENYTYHDPLIRTNELPLYGFESFEEGDKTYFMKRISRNTNPYAIKVGISTEKAFSGDHSFKILHLDSYQKYLLTFKTLFINGSIEFSLMVFLSSESQYKFDFGIGRNIIVKYEKIFLHTSKGLVLGNYSYNKWLKIGIKANVGDLIQNQEKQTCTLIIDNEEITLNITKKDFKAINSIAVTSEGTGVSYIDDIRSNTDQYVEPYFSNCLEQKSNDTSIDDQIDSSINDQIDSGVDEPNNNEPNKSKLSSGAIAGIVVGIVVFISICAIIIFILVKRKMNIHHSSELEV